MKSDIKPNMKRGRERERDKEKAKRQGNNLHKP